MKGILGTTWGASVLSAIFGAMLIALVGIVVGAPPAVTIFAAVLFGALLILIVQLGVVVTILWQTRGTASDVGATMKQEIETPAGKAALKEMNFTSLLTVAVVQELYVSLFKRDEPLWVWAFLGIGSDKIIPRDYGKWNRYLEWALVIGLIIFSIVGALLIATFANSIGALFCAMPAFLVGAVLMFFVGLFSASVIRRLFILYSMRTDESNIQ
jgi:hypothetical protein